MKLMKRAAVHNIPSQCTIFPAPLRSNTKNHYQFLAEVERFLSMLHS